MTSGEWGFFWLFVFLLGSKKSTWRMVVITGMIYCCLSSCTPKGYSYREARQVQRQHDHRVAANLNQRRATWKQQQRQKDLQRVDAAAHRRIK